MDKARRSRSRPTKESERSGRRIGLGRAEKEATWRSVATLARKVVAAIRVTGLREPADRVRISRQKLTSSARKMPSPHNRACHFGLARAARKHVIRPSSLSLSERPRDYQIVFTLFSFLSQSEAAPANRATYRK